MNKKIKIILLTLFITLIFQKSGQESIVNKIDKSVIVDIKIIRPEEKIETSYEQIHSATWYNLHNHYTASGEKFHKDSLTAAYNYEEFGTYLKVTNLSNNESIIVKVIDRMGNKSPNRIDLSICAFDSIANLSSGRVKVIIEVVK